MIIKSVFVALSLFIFYSIFIISAPKWWNASQHQWQDNVIRAQNFLYDNQDSIKSVIIGSSLSCHLVMDSLPNVYNLSFSGQSIFDGLNVLISKGNFPKNIFIETNIVLKPENPDFISTLTSPILFHSKKMLPALREDKQPIGILGKTIKVFINSCFSLHKPSQNREDNKSKSSLFNKMLQLKITEYSTLPKQNLISEQFSKLSEHITFLKNKGVNIVFFEMPFNEKLTYLPKAKMLRKTFYEKFPDSIYKFIPIQDSIKYQTTDGLHLNQEEAIKYSIYLKSKMKS